ncbi:MAG: hypothetical protein O2856_02605 [Planctomycetota bacterium]|nr:hypothetical protein [Planctomycetota bacterium]
MTSTADNTAEQSHSYSDGPTDAEARLAEIRHDPRDSNPNHTPEGMPDAATEHLRRRL